MTLSSAFKQIREQNPNVGQVPCLIKAVRQVAPVAEAEINKVFNTIDKDEYLRSERDEILAYIYEVGKSLS
jgi:hypothetical protein